MMSSFKSSHNSEKVLLNFCNAISLLNTLITRLIFSGTLQLHCQFRYCRKMSSVCRLFVTRVYCDKMVEAKNMQFSLKCSPML